MLIELKIANFLTIEEAHLSLAEGFTVFTGETGAGKSILLKALLLVLGERGSPSYIHPEAKELEVEALIYGGKTLAHRLEELGFAPEEELHVRRILSPHKQRVYLNGSPVSLSELAKVTAGLIEFTSQHEFYSLFDRKNQLSIYDHLLCLTEELSKFQKLYTRYKDLERKSKGLEEKLRSAVLKRDYLEFQLKEIAELNPNLEEEKALLSLRARLKNLTILKQTASLFLETLNQINKPLRHALSMLDRLSQFEPTLKERRPALEGLYYEVDDLLRLVGALLSELPEDAESLDEVEARLAKYERLKKKYQTTVEGLLKLKEEIKSELSTLDTGEEELKRLKQVEDALLEELFTAAEGLSQARKKGKPRLEGLIAEELASLGLQGSCLIFNVVTKDKIPANLTPYGLDEMEILYRSNPGLPARPLEKVASGGELSRLYLIMKALVPVDRSSTLIFDEVDAGVGGVVAKKVGERLQALSTKHQVICITHLPQIASLAEHHFLVEKLQEGERTVTLIRQLTHQERIKELARMLGKPHDLSLAEKLLISRKDD